MFQSSYDTDPELMLFSRVEQMGMLDVVKDEVGVDLSQEMEEISDSLVTSAASNEQVGSESAVTAGDQGRSADPVTAATPRLTPPTGDSVPVITRWPGLHTLGLTVCRWAAGSTPTCTASPRGSCAWARSPRAVRFSYRAVQDPAQLQIRALPVYCDAQHVQTRETMCSTPEHGASVQLRDAACASRGSH